MPEITRNSGEIIAKFGSIVAKCAKEIWAIRNEKYVNAKLSEAEKSGGGLANDCRRFSTWTVDWISRDTP